MAAWYDRIKVTVIPKKAVFIVVPSNRGEVQVSLPYGRRYQALATTIEGLLYEVKMKEKLNAD